MYQAHTILLTTTTTYGTRRINMQSTLLLYEEVFDIISLNLVMKRTTAVQCLAGKKKISFREAFFFADKVKNRLS